MTSPNDSLVTLQGALRHVASNWRIVTAITVLGAALGVAAAFLPEPRYKAEAVLTATRDDATSAGLASLAGGIGGLASIVGMNPESGARQTEGVLVMQSRTFAGRFIQENGLMPILFAEYWDAERKQWIGPFAKRPPSVAKAADHFVARMLKVEEDKKTNSVRVSIEWRDPVQAALWVNQYVSRLNEQLRLREIAEAKQSLGYLSQEINATSMIETRAVLYRVTEAQLQKKTLATVRRDFVFRVIDPAEPSEPDDIFWPRRVLTVSLGVLLGMLAGCFLSLLLPRRGMTARVG